MMIKGMTGFGNAAFSAGRVKGMVEVKSQNHRYLDIVYYLPMGFGSIESGIRQMIGQHISRGRVSISIKITEKPFQHLTYNKDAVNEYLKYARNLKKDYRLENDLKLSDLIKLPGVIEAKEVLLTGDDLWPAIEKGLKKALDGLSRMRDREGKTLRADTAGVLQRMSMRLKTIQSRSKAIIAEKKAAMTLDELSSFQKSADISEEMTRLKHYIDEFKLLLASSTGVGKKLDFVAQEMQRETNTIGSKVQDQVVSNAVIALKSKIEKLREQAQNIE